MSGPGFAHFLCHCKNCRHFNAASPVAVVGYPDNGQAVKVLEGEEFIKAAKRTAEQEKMNSSEGFSRNFCCQCGSGLWNKINGKALMVFAGNIEKFPFNTTAHVNYENATLRIKDGVVKYKAFPPPYGSGEVAEE